jgi:hypothetical protein
MEGIPSESLKLESEVRPSVDRKESNSRISVSQPSRKSLERCRALSVQVPFGVNVIVVMSLVRCHGRGSSGNPVRPHSVP